jgi:DNA-directed RNA polymerase specialized sigma24 family protein
MMTSRAKKRKLGALFLLMYLSAIHNDRNYKRQLMMELEDDGTVVDFDERKRMAIKSHAGLTNQEYKNWYRVSKRTFRAILGEIDYTLAHGLARYSPEMQLAMFLKHCALGLPYRAMCTEYGCKLPTLRSILHRVRNVLIKLGRKKRMKWPSPDEQRESARIFAEKQPILDSAFGAIDGTHVRVNENQDQKHYYVNRKGWPSTTIMAVCDARMRFIYVAAGAPGSAHDARVFRCSNLPDLLHEDHTLPGMFLLGDAAYGSSPYMLVPTESESRPGEATFNFIHSSLRMTIERTFGVFKG